MRVYTSGINNTTDLRSVVAAKAPRLLVSFWEVQSGKLGPRFFPTLVEGLQGPHFLDSGAYSAMSKGVTIDLVAFADYWRANAGLFEGVSNLDVIGDPRKSAANLADLRGRGVPAIPVWHVTSPLAELDAMCRENDYVAFGGVVPYTRRTGIRQGMLRRAWDIVFRYWPRKVHGFGIADASTLRAHPWFSVDATSAMQKAMFGWVFQSYGEPGAARHVPGASRDERIRASVSALVDFERRVTAEWAAKGVRWEVP